MEADLTKNHLAKLNFLEALTKLLQRNLKVNSVLVLNPNKCSHKLHRLNHSLDRDFKIIRLKIVKILVSEQVFNNNKIIISKMLKVILVSLIQLILGLDFNKTIYTKLKPKKLYPSLTKFNHKTI